MNRLLVTLSLILISCFHVSANVIWYANPNSSTNVNDFFRRFDSGNYPTDYCYTPGDEAGTQTPKVTTPIDPTYGRVWKINKPVNRKRGEFARAEGDADYYAPAEGDDIYIGWRWKIDTENGTTITDEVTVWQWKSAGTHNQNYPLNMEYDGDLTLNAWGPDYNNSVSQAAMRTVLWRKAIPQDTWVSFVVRIKVDKDDFGGIVQFWYNGVQQQLMNSDFNKYQVNLSADKYTAYHRTNDGSDVYPKWGIYNKKSCSYNASAYFDEMRIASTLNEAMPSGSVSNQPPTVDFDTPTNGLQIEEGYSELYVKATPNDDGGIDNLKLYVNNNLIRQESNAPYEWGHDASPEIQAELLGLGVGSHTLKVVATDAEGAIGEKSITITVLARDCHGDLGGSAEIDDCGECSGGNTGKIPNETCTDCYGDVNGTAEMDQCNVCSGGNTGITTDACLQCNTVEASDAQNPNFPENVLDNDLNTRWSAEGVDQTITFCLGTNKMIESVSLAFYQGDVRSTTFNVEYSLDGITYMPLLTNQISSGNSLDPETFIFPPTEMWKLRIVGKGNSVNAWNSITEISWTEAQVTGINDYEKTDLNMYPNPTNDIIQFTDNNSHQWTLQSIQGIALERGNSGYIDLSTYSTGLYLIVVEGKIIKVNRE